MAVEEPDARVVGPEAEDEVAGGGEHYCVSPHGHGGESDVGGTVPGTCLLIAPVHELEDATVEMEGVFAVVSVVEDDLDDFAVLEDERVGVGSVYGWVGRVIPRGEGRVQGRDLGSDI